MQNQKEHRLFASASQALFRVQEKHQIEQVLVSFHTFWGPTFLMDENAKLQTPCISGHGLFCTTFRDLLPVSQFLNVPGVWVYCDPTEEQKSYAGNVPKNVGWIARLGATTPRADTTGSRTLSSAWRQARDEKGDCERRRLYLYSRSAISRSAEHDEPRRRHLCYFGNE